VSEGEEKRGGKGWEGKWGRGGKGSYRYFFSPHRALLLQDLSDQDHFINITALTAETDYVAVKNY